MGHTERKLFKLYCDNCGTDDTREFASLDELCANQNTDGWTTKVTPFMGVEQRCPKCNPDTDAPSDGQTLEGQQAQSGETGVGCSREDGVES